MDKLTLRVPFSQAERKLGRIGRDGEAIVRQVLFDCRDVLRGWESASIVCAYWRPEDEAPYLVPLAEVESGVFAFVVRQEDVAKVGTVRMELRRIDGESVLKSATYTATVEKSINAAPVDPGSPEEDMLTELGEAAGKATLAAKAANEAAASVDESKAAAVAAAEAATQAASNADASAAKADTAAASAEESASKADASATKADTATANANDAADKATSAATTATESAEKADTAATSANTSAANADTAATNAQNVADTVQAKLDAGEFKGEKGDKGDTGSSGKDCVYMDYTIPAGYTTPYVSTYNVPVTAFTNTPSGGDIIVALHADGYLGRWKVKSLSYASGGYVVVLELRAIRKITGEDGTDGISPTVTTSKADGVTTVTITDKDGAHTANIEDGAKGDAGAEALRATKNYAATYTTIGCDASWSTDFFNRMPVVGDIFTNIDASSNTGTWKITSVSGGLAHFTLLSYVSSKGADGFSPTATVTKSGTTTTVTVTDKTGTTTAEVKDGSDATVTKDAIVDALGYEPVKPEGNYELIEEITLTEDTTEIIRTQEPDGTAYKFSTMCVNFKTPFSGSRYVLVRFSDDLAEIDKYQSYIRISQNTTAAGRYGFTRVDCVRERNEWRIYQRECMSAWSTPNVSYYTTVQEGTLSFCEHWTAASNAVLCSLRIIKSEVLPSGTTISIYAIRA